MPDSLFSHKALWIVGILLLQLQLIKYVLRSRLHLGVDDVPLNWNRLINGLILISYLLFSYLLITKISQQAFGELGLSLLPMGLIFLVSSWFVYTFIFSTSVQSTMAKPAENLPSTDHLLIHTNVIDLIAESKTHEAMELLELKAKQHQSSSALEDFLLIKSKYNSIERRSMQGLGTPGQIEVEHQLLKKSMLYWIKRYLPSDSD